MMQDEKRGGSRGGNAPKPEQPTLDDDRMDVHLETAGAARIPAMDMDTEWVLAVAQTKDDRIAKKARSIRTLRAARGSRTNMGKNVRRPLAHPRLKTTLLSDEHRSILSELADAQEELPVVLGAALEKILQVDLLEADLLRCKAALERKDWQDAEYAATGLYPEARHLIARLARLGIREGHFSTVTDATLSRIFELIRGDNSAAGVGSPDDPQVEIERARKSR